MRGGSDNGNLQEQLPRGVGALQIQFLHKDISPLPWALFPMTGNKMFLFSGMP